MSVRRVGQDRTAGPSGVFKLSYPQRVVSRSPQAYYRFGEASGTPLVDASGKGHNGLYVNGVTLGATSLITNDTDTAASFASASSQFAEVPFGSWMTGWTQLTLIGWIKPTITGTHTLVARDLVGTNGPWRLRINSSKLEFLLWHTSLTVLAGGTSLSSGTRYHVAAKYDGATMKVFVNGVADGSSAQTGSLNSTDSPSMRFGTFNAGGEFMNGVVDEFQVYNIALSDAEIAADYAAGV